jgi:hypothetical protein
MGEKKSHASKWPTLNLSNTLRVMIFYAVSCSVPETEGIDSNVSGVGGQYPSEL